MRGESDRERPPDGEQNLRARMAHLEDQFEELSQNNRLLRRALGQLPTATRRQLLAAAGAGTFGAAAFASGRASAAPSASDSDGDIGSPSSRFDGWADSIEVATDIVPDADGGADLGTSGLRFGGNYFESVDISDLLEFQDAATAPTANGEIRRDGADLKVFSGGAVQNLSDIGASANNVPDWSEDGNSPLNHSGSSAAAYTLASSYDLVKVFVSNIDGSSSSNFQLELTVDGDTGANYDYRSIDGTLSSNANSFPAAAARSGGETGAIMHLTGRWVGACGFASMPMEFSGAVAFSGQNDNATSPLDSFTLTQASGGNWSADIEVYGVNVG